MYLSPILSPRHYDLIRKAFGNAKKGALGHYKTFKTNKPHGGKIMKRQEKFRETFDLMLAKKQLFPLRVQTL